MTPTILIETLETTAEAIALNPQHYLSRRRMLSVSRILKTNGLKEQSERVNKASNGRTDDMIDLLREIANSI